MAKLLNIKKLNDSALNDFSTLNVALVEEAQLKSAKKAEQAPFRKVANSDSATTTEKREALVKIDGVDKKYAPLLKTQREIKERAITDLFDDETLSASLYTGYLWSLQTDAIDNLNSTTTQPVQLAKGLKTKVEVSFSDAISTWFETLGLELTDKKATKRTIAKIARYASSVRIKFSLGKDGKYVDDNGDVVATYLRTSSRKKVLEDLVLSFMQVCIVENKCFNVTEDGLISIRPKEDAESAQESEQN